MQNVPQGLKPHIYWAFCGTAEAVPFRKQVYATTSNLTCANRSQRAGSGEDFGLILVRRNRVGQAVRGNQ
jgi:hypothetical protein